MLINTKLKGLVKINVLPDCLLLFVIKAEFNSAHLHIKWVKIHGKFADKICTGNKKSVTLIP